MERAVFDRMAEQDSSHWWYVARRRVLADLIARRIALPQDARLLEIGCGTGHNFAMLERFGRIDAIELDERARALAAERLGRPVGDARLPDLEGVPEGKYHLIALLDVLEHVDEDVASLRSIARRLAPGGRILITVPAYPWMWSAHDAAHHHKRRYAKAALRRVIAEAGLEAELVTHFNSILFPLAAGVRLAGKALGKTSSDDSMPPPLLNRLFTGLFGLERHLVGRAALPFGVSLAAICAPGSSIR
jgi:SAM-dependent methyltransferase